MPVIRTHTSGHSFLTQPALADSLWRYMDFSKFVAMLVNKGLYLSRLDKLGDAYEGWVPQSPKGYYDGFLGRKFMQRDLDLRKQSQASKLDFFISCWHANERQSDAMWKLYSKGTEGIAIRTTSRNLQAALTDAPEDLWLYEVMYADLEKEPIHGGSMVRACVTKRIPFAHEKEVRVVWHNSEPPVSIRKKHELDSGFYVNCNMTTLIEQVYVAPTENPWFVPIVKDVLVRYGINAEVVQSGLSLTPP